MPIYEDVMRGQGSQALGLGATTEQINLPEPLQEMTPELYESIWGPSGTPDVVSTGTDLPTPENPRQADHVSDVGGRGGKIVRAAQSLVGTPYVWGGTSASGVDCSGLVYLAYKSIGVNLPRVSYQQANAGRRVALGSLQAGDLVAWNNSTRNPGADHIAIYIGGGRIIEAPRPGVPVRIRKLGENEGAWGVRILGGQ